MDKVYAARDVGGGRVDGGAKLRHLGVEVLFLVAPGEVLQPTCVSVSYAT